MKVYDYEIKPGANLRYANLSGADLSAVDLTNAKLHGADLHETNLYHANLSKADLSRADLSYTDLTGANLYKANLQNADLTGANFTGSNLCKDDLRGAKLPDYKVCPETGSFVAYKKLHNNLIAKLEIPAEAKRTSCLVSNKCRAEFAKVLDIYDNNRKKYEYGYSWYNVSFIYDVGITVRPDYYDNDIRVDCSHGIHFFMTEKEAVNFLL